MIDNETVRMITEDVLVSMLELPTQFDVPWSGECSEEGYRATIEIHQDIALEGVLLCNAAFARRIAAQMFMCTSEDVCDTKAADAVGELINIIGGNVKGAIGGDGTLTLPKVQKGYRPADNLGDDHVNSLSDIVAFCDGHPMRMMFQMLETAATSQ